MEFLYDRRIKIYAEKSYRAIIACLKEEKVDYTPINSRKKNLSSSNCKFKPLTIEYIKEKKDKIDFYTKYYKRV